MTAPSALIWVLLGLAGLTALGVGLLTLGLGRWGLHLYRSMTRKRFWLALEQSRSARANATVSVEELYGIPPLLPWVILSAGVGWVIGRLLLAGPARNLGALAGAVPLVWKQYRIREGRRQVQREIADLVERLRLYLGFATTPGTALRLTIDDAPDGILWEHLRRQRDTLRVTGAEVVLEQVATQLHVSALRRLVARVRAAQAGSTKLTEALHAATEELTRDLRRDMEEQVEAAPTRLLIPMLILLMVPLLIIVLTPPVQTLLDTLAGVGPAPLGG